jgi:hypothetical protein
MLARCGIPRDVSGGATSCCSIEWFSHVTGADSEAEGLRSHQRLVRLR